MKDKEREDLLKIPAEVVISELRVELGKSNSRVAELEDALRELKSSAQKLVDPETKINNLKNELALRDTKLVNMKSQLSAEKAKHADTIERLRQANVKIETMQRQLINSHKNG